MPNVCSRETNPCQEPDNSDQKKQVHYDCLGDHLGLFCTQECWLPARLWSSRMQKKISTWEGNETQLVQQLGCLMALCLFYKLVKKQHQTYILVRFGLRLWPLTLVSNLALTWLSTRDSIRATTWSSSHASIRASTHALTWWVSWSGFVARVSTRALTRASTWVSTWVSTQVSTHSLTLWVFWLGFPSTWASIGPGLGPQLRC